MIISWGISRKVELRAQAKERIEEIQKSGPPMYYEAYLGLAWLLARSPEIGLPKLDKFIYVQEADKSAKTPYIYTLYDYTAEIISFYVIIFSFPRNNLRDFTP